jgi:alginate O-acetyltransferase complex protein AlgI
MRAGASFAYISVLPMGENFMVFSSITFIFIFLPIFILLYYVAPFKFKNPLLFIGSLIFYSIGEPYYLFLIICSITVNYFVGRLIGHFDKKPKIRVLILVIDLIYNFGFLIFFKYTNFFIENINALLRLLGLTFQMGFLDITLPLGISFYTFQIVSYIIDVYKRKVNPDKSYINLGAYICMFPQLIAGPIVVYSDISDSLKSRTISVTSLDKGLRDFIIGLGYKVIIANQIGTLWNEVCTIGYESLSTPIAWLGAFAYSMQLFFDFWGYSLMAIGLGEMLGFRLPENFNFPYVSRSVTQFWRRWHMTLGSWFKEYVYIPLGGNRKGKIRTVFNLFVVWFLVGFWHGAAWNFILWGLMIFILLVIEKNLTLKWLNADNIFAMVFSHVYIIFYILISWTIFAISDFGDLGTYLVHMFDFSWFDSLNISIFTGLIKDYWWLLICSIIFATPYPRKLFNKVKEGNLGNVILFVIFWICIYYLSIGENNPFLYFRF